MATPSGDGGAGEASRGAAGAGGKGPAGAGGKGAAGATKPPTQEQIVAGFQELRNQQRAIISKISEIDMERKEHDLVMEALREVDSARKCFRMVGGVLVERTVGDVLPALVSNHEQLVKLGALLSQQLETKGKDLQDYREKYHIRVRGEEEGGRGGAGGSTATRASNSGVLVGGS